MNTRNAFGHPLVSAAPAPYPTAVGRIKGSGPYSSTSTLSSAIPVGVVSSRGGPALYTGNPRDKAATAGPGTGKRPCLESVIPEPKFTDEEVTRSTPRRWHPSNPPITSTRESTTPTSWNRTAEGLTRWALPSALASRRNTSRPCALTRAGMRLVAMIRWMRRRASGAERP